MVNVIPPSKEHPFYVVEGLIDGNGFAYKVSDEKDVAKAKADCLRRTVEKYG